MYGVIPPLKKGNKKGFRIIGIILHSIKFSIMIHFSAKFTAIDISLRLISGDFSFILA